MFQINFFLLGPFERIRILYVSTRTSNSVHAPYLINAISSGSIFHALRTNSISYFHEKGGANLQFELDKGRLLERGGLIELLRYIKTYGSCQEGPGCSSVFRTIGAFELQMPKRTTNEKYSKPRNYTAYV